LSRKRPAALSLAQFLNPLGATNYQVKQASKAAGEDDYESPNNLVIALRRFIPQAIHEGPDPQKKTDEEQYQHLLHAQMEGKHE
jgi:hypothetical protein